MCKKGFPGGSVVKNLPANAGDVGLISFLGRSPGEGNGNPLQYSCLENPMDRGAWWATVHEVARSWPWLNTHVGTQALRDKELFWNITRWRKNIWSLIVYYDDGDDLQILTLIFLWVGEIDPPDYLFYLQKTKIVLVINTVQIKCIYKSNWTCLLKISFDKIEFIHLSHKVNSLTSCKEQKFSLNQSHNTK